MITWIMKANNFQIAEFQHQGVTYRLLNFLQTLARRYLKSVAHKK